MLVTLDKKQFTKILIKVVIKYYVLLDSIIINE